jgi:hypothetical protein
MDSPNWLAKNSKKLIFLFILGFIILIAIITENIIGFMQNIVPLRTEKRYISLRELDPSVIYSGYFKPLKKEFKLRTDKNGFIIPSKVHEAPDLVLVFLGGSTTECLTVSEEKRFPYLAGRNIEKNTGLKVNSFNSGVSGNDSLHSINILMNKIIPMEPNIVIMMHNVNDLAVLLYEGTYWNNNQHRSPIVTNHNLANLFKEIKNRTFPNLYRVITGGIFKGAGDEFAHTRGKKISIQMDLMVHNFTLNLKTFIYICKSRNIIPVLMTMANRLNDFSDPDIKTEINKMNTHGITSEEFIKIFDTFNQTIIKVGNENRVLVIDLAQKIPKRKEYIHDVVHYDDKGSEYAASIISDSLINIAESSRLPAPKSD